MLMPPVYEVDARPVSWSGTRLLFTGVLCRACGKLSGSSPSVCRAACMWQSAMSLIPSPPFWRSSTMSRPAARPNLRPGFSTSIWRNGWPCPGSCSGGTVLGGGVLFPKSAVPEGEHSQRRHHDPLHDCECRLDDEIVGNGRHHVLCGNRDRGEAPGKNRANGAVGDAA